MQDAIIYIDSSKQMNLQNQIRLKLVDGILNGAFPPGMKLPSSRKLAQQLDVARNTNGFRTYDVTEELGCENPTWLTTMSGFGGINIVLMPNDTAYYYFSDGNVHRYLHAVRESHRIRPMCQ